MPKRRTRPKFTGQAYYAKVMSTNRMKQPTHQPKKGGIKDYLKWKYRQTSKKYAPHGKVSYAKWKHRTVTKKYELFPLTSHPTGKNVKRKKSSDPNKWLFG